MHHPIPPPAWIAFVWVVTTGLAACPLHADAGDELRAELTRLSDRVVEFSGDFEYWGQREPGGPVVKESYGSVTTTAELSGSPLLLHRHHPNAISVTDPSVPKRTFFETVHTFAYDGKRCVQLGKARERPASRSTPSTKR